MELPCISFLLLLSKLSLTLTSVNLFIKSLDMVLFSFILEFFQILLLESEPSHAWYTLSNVLLLLPMYSTARGAGGGGASIRRDCPKK